MNKSNIEAGQPEEKPNNEQKVDNSRSAQVSANANVVRQDGEKRDTYSTGFKRALQIINVQIDNKIYKTKKRNPKPNTFPQAYNNGYLKALNHVKALVESRLKNLDDGKQVW